MDRSGLFRKRVVVAEPFAEHGLAVLRDAGIEVESLVGRPRSELLAALAEADGLIVRSERGRPTSDSTSIPASRSTASPCSANGSATTTRLRNRPLRSIGRSCTHLPPRLQGALTVAIAFVVPLVVLLGSVRTSVGFWDTADLQTVTWIAGIPYPTGYPGYVAIGWLWAHVVPCAPVAARHHVRVG